MSKKIGVMLIVLSLLLPSLAFMGDLSKAEIALFSSSITEVDPDETINIPWDIYNNWGTVICYTITFTNNGENVGNDYVCLNTGQHKTGTLTFNAPNTPGTYTVTMTEKFPFGPSQTITTRSKSITYTVRGTPPLPTYSITLSALYNSIPISGATVSLANGIVGSTNSNGQITITNLTGIQTVILTKDGYKPYSKTFTMDKDYTTTIIMVPSDDLVCPTLYQPVCGIDGITYSNECFARVANVEIDYYGECSTPTAAPTIKPTPTGNATPTPKILYFLTFIIIDSKEIPIKGIDVFVDDIRYQTDKNGKLTLFTSPNAKVDVIVIVEGYNRVSKQYLIESDETTITIQLSDSNNGSFFTFNPNNPFNDPEGIAGAIPIWSALISSILFITGIIVSVKGIK